MNFLVAAHAYNVQDYGTFSMVPEFLLEQAGDFGGALSELTVSFHFASKGAARKTLGGLKREFEAARRKLPKVVFRRGRGQAAIDVASEFMNGKTLEGSRPLSLRLFKAALAETIGAIALLRGRLSAADDFRLDDFLAHCRRRQAELPSSAKDFAAQVEAYWAQSEAREAALSPWERLHIDWRDYHPDARTILDDPFFWEEDNLFAPHGNDTGADLLWSYRGWLRRTPKGDPLEFYERLLGRWGVRATRANEQFGSVRDEAAVALAFAELKMRAACRRGVVPLARAALGRQRQQALDAIKWPHRDERLRSLERLEAKLPR
jgi:hypothetical protein